jgi:hypothetical protein
MLTQSYNSNNGITPPPERNQKLDNKFNKNTEIGRKPRADGSSSRYRELDHKGVKAKGLQGSNTNSKKNLHPIGKKPTKNNLDTSLMSVKETNIPSL